LVLARVDIENHEQRWTAPRPLTWREWDGEYVAYDGLSGDTHLCDGITAEILHQLSFAPMTRQALVERVARRLQLEPDSNLGDYIGQCLEELTRRSLIFPVKP
jgi:PqqD family protein of HPr-rel-A system